MELWSYCARTPMAQACDHMADQPDPDDKPVAYIERTRAWYAALGFAEPFRWASFADVPFTPLRKPLNGSRIALVTTAALGRSTGKGYAASAKFASLYSGETARPPELRNDHVAIDFAHAAGDDTGRFLPLARMREAVADGRLGGVTERFHGLPTNRSERMTAAVDAPELLARCHADGADAAILVPNCPVCHQCCAIAARTLEAAGIPSVIIGSAKDVIEHIGVPRFLFVDFPLGNSAGKPGDPRSQRRIFEQALRVLESATEPRSTVKSPERWSDDLAWKRDYGAFAQLSPDELRQHRAAFDEQAAIARQIFKR